MKEFTGTASVRLAELEDLFVDMKARVSLWSFQAVYMQAMAYNWYMWQKTARNKVLVTVWKGINEGSQPTDSKGIILLNIDKQG